MACPSGSYLEIYPLDKIPLLLWSSCEMTSPLIDRLWLVQEGCQRRCIVNSSLLFDNAFVNSIMWSSEQWVWPTKAVKRIKKAYRLGIVRTTIRLKQERQ